MTKWLIVNADDFGISPGQNYGIIECYQQGIVSSTTAMVLSPWIEHAVTLSQANPGLGVGLHFVLTQGTPLTAATSLVNAHGKLGQWLWEYAEQGSLNAADIYVELAAQYDQFVALFGRPPTHIDSHHFIHMWPAIYPVVARFAAEKSLPIRLDRHALKACPLIPHTPHSTDFFDARFHGSWLCEELFLSLLDDATERGDQSLEIRCHPAFIDTVLLQSAYCHPRAQEVDILTSSSLKQKIARRGYRLINFAALTFTQAPVPSTSG